ncbi:MAG TPA: glycosyltransferase [Candidatus Dormibacteraeota bacterium]|nr:glycosyltransferase [Candidatus Dormibacteraeota bacterium]
MRILNVTESYAPFYEFGGPPAKVEALSRGLAERGNEVTVLTADWGVEKRIAGTAQESSFKRSPFGWAGEDRRVKALYLPTWLRYRATSWNPAIGRFLNARLNQFDVAHIFGLYDLLGPAVAKACRKQKVPYVVEPIGMFLPIVRNVLLKKIYHSFYGREMLSGAVRVIATSDQEVGELLEGGIAREKIELRRNGVMKPECVPERGTFRRARGITDDALVVLFLGRLSEKKTPDLLLKAFSALAPKIDGRTMQLVFAGPDEQGMENRLRASANELQVAERVQFTGPIFGEEKWAAYRDADVFVLPSRNENFGNTAAESAAIGTPVIVTENCGVAPLLAEAGLIIPHDEAALVKALNTLLRNETLRTRLGRQGVNVAARIGWEEPVELMESLYRKLAEFK